VNLADLTVRVALGEVGASEQVPDGRPGVRSHSLSAILVGMAAQSASRRDLLRTLVQAIQRRGLFADSVEDLTPVYLDPPSLVVLGVVVGQLLLRPRVARRISASVVDAYSLTADAVETIIGLDER
jgi:hypothetical protein